MVDGHHGHGGVEGPVREREVLRSSTDLVRSRVLVEHDLGGIHGGDVHVIGLIGAGPGTDIDHRARLAQRLPDQRGKSRVGHPHLPVAGTDAVIGRRRGTGSSRIHAADPARSGHTGPDI
jgi:hypothetical protein